MLSAAGLPSSYGRAVIPVNRLHSVEAPTLNQLHPSVAQVDVMTCVVHFPRASVATGTLLILGLILCIVQLRARRDPYYYDSKTFKITMETRPWGEPSKTYVSAPFVN
jgi:hypothetical protein